MAISASEPDCGDCRGTGEVCRGCEVALPVRFGLCEPCEALYAAELASATADRMHAEAAELLNTIESAWKIEREQFDALRASVRNAIEGLARLAP